MLIRFIMVISYAALYSPVMALQLWMSSDVLSAVDFIARICDIIHGLVGVSEWTRLALTKREHCMADHRNSAGQWWMNSLSGELFFSRYSTLRWRMGDVSTGNAVLFHVRVFISGKNYHLTICMVLPHLPLNYSCIWAICCNISQAFLLGMPGFPLVGFICFPFHCTLT